MADNYENAYYYDCRESEDLSHSSPEEAIEELIDQAYEKDKPIEQTIADCCPIEMVGYVRKKIDLRHGEHYVDNMLESLEEEWGEEYGDFDGDVMPWKKEQRVTVTKEFYSLMEKHLKDAHIWQCDPCGKREYSEDEVLVMMREYCPEWFEDLAKGTG